MLSVELDVARAVRSLNATADEIARAVEPALDRYAQVVLNAKARQVQRTYNRPIPKSKNGKPKWKRSGDFQRGQTIESETGKRTIKVTGNAEKYEGRLSELPVSKDGVNRRNAAAPDAARIAEPLVKAAFEQELRNAIQGNR